MVVFTCEACNESLKKNKVEAHLYQCRRSRHVTCIDCQVDFDHESYKGHTSCISESEKYSGPGYVPKASTNKGARKQDDWFQRVQSAIGSSSGMANPHLASVLQKVSESANVPRKQAKFVNFCRNSMKWASPALIQQAWTLIAESAQQPKTSEAEPVNGGPKVEPEPAAEAKKQKKCKMENGENDREEKITPEAVSTIDKKNEKAPGADVEESKQERKSKKRRKEAQAEQTAEAEPEAEQQEQRRKKKKQNKLAEEPVTEAEVEPEAEAEAAQQKQRRKKKERKLAETVEAEENADETAETAALSGEEQKGEEEDRKMRKKKKKKKTKRQHKEEEKTCDIVNLPLSCTL